MIRVAKSAISQPTSHAPRRRARVGQAPPRPAGGLLGSLTGGTASSDDDSDDDAADGHRRPTRTASTTVVDPDGVTAASRRSLDRPSWCRGDRAGRDYCPPVRHRSGGQRSSSAQASTSNDDRDDGRRVRPRPGHDPARATRRSWASTCRAACRSTSSRSRTARSTTRSKPEQLDEAIEIIRRRVDASGVAEPEVSRQGNTILIQIPGRQGPAGGRSTRSDGPPSSSSGRCSARPAGRSTGDDEDRGGGRGGGAADRAQHSRGRDRGPGRRGRAGQAAPTTTAPPPAAEAAPTDTAGAATDHGVSRHDGRSHLRATAAVGRLAVAARRAARRRSRPPIPPPRRSRRRRSTSTASTSTTRSSASCTSSNSS